MKFHLIEKMLFIALASLFVYALFGASLTNIKTSPYVQANRYSSCFEKLSESSQLSFEEMEKVCVKYLED